MLAYSIYIVFPPAYMKQCRPSDRSRIFPLFMKMEVSFLCTQEPTNGSYSVAGKFRSALQEFCCLTAALLKGFCIVWCLNDPTIRLKYCFHLHGE